MMKNFRRRILARMWAFSAVIAAAALTTLRYTGVLGRFFSEGPETSPVLSFREGLLFSSAVLSLFWLARYARAHERVRHTPSRLFPLSP